MASGGKGQPVFLREATGLVKAWSTRDAFYYVALQLSIGLWINFTISTNAFAWPGGNPILGGLLATLLFAVPSAVYAMLLVVLPRSGGDYVFQTRILRLPLISYIALGLWLVGNAWFLPFVWSAVGGTSWAPFVAWLGVHYGNQSLINAAAWLTTPNAIFYLGFFIVFWMWLVNAFGLKTYGRIQFYFFWIAIAASVVFYIWLFATPTQTFINGFNSIAPALGGNSTNAYQDIMTMAANNGFNPSYNFSFYQSLAMVGSLSAIFVIGYYTALGGEIRKAGTLRSQMIISVGGCVFVGLMNTILNVGAENLVGHQFNAAAGYLSFNGLWPLKVPPLTGLYTMSIASSLVLPIIALIYFNAWTWMNYPNILPYNSRVSMAMAFDRMLPASMARVNDRWHIPLFNINIWTLMCLGLVFFAWIYSKFGQLFLMSSFCLSFVIILSCAAGAVLPFSKSLKQSYIASSVAKYKIGALPVITLLGVIGILLELFIDYLFLTNPFLGVSGGNIAFSVEFLIALAIFFAALYLGFKYYNRSKGIDVNLAFSEIPPE